DHGAPVTLSPNLLHSSTPHPIPPHVGGGKRCYQRPAPHSSTPHPCISIAEPVKGSSGRQPVSTLGLERPWDSLGAAPSYRQSPNSCVDTSPNRKAGLDDEKPEGGGMSADVVIGIDVSKAPLDIGVLTTGEVWQSANETQALSDLASRLLELAPKLVVMEATGGLEIPVAAALSRGGLPV